MDYTHNPYRGAGMSHPQLDAIPWPLADAAPVLELLQRCPRAGRTPLAHVPELAQAAGVADMAIKDERARMGMGSFKALGAAYVIACDARDGVAAGRTYVTASAGNHGLSVAAGAAAFGARARIYIAETVPEGFAERLRGLGAEVVREGTVYEDSMAAAAQAAESEGLALLSDSSWAGYTRRPHRLMEGYLVLMAEAVSDLARAPTHILLQAGVGGLAAACAAHARAAWGDAPLIFVVEPEAAPALTASIAAGAPIETPGPVSIMGRLDCKAPSLIALKGLARDADGFLTISEAEARAGTAAAEAAGFASTPSGAAGLAAALASGPLRERLALTDSARVLTILSEAPEA
ncbi:MAG: pyridoxal-phosphate dependent enzyme [Rhodobacteraceae bacterium]|nr:pyridoxal-phosphate dependent enzyme [Paracoccaceae bacterium]